MVSNAMALLKDIERQYAFHGDLSFSRILRDFNVAADEDALSELIEADGRARITLNKHVDLERYLEAIPDLENKSVALDAAIDVTLRSLSASSRPTAEAVETLVGNYPHLAASIREAASLAEALWSTTGLQRRLIAPPRELPAEFGPRLRSGQARYQLRRLLGKGGWGEVYLALDRQLCDAQHEALVAIKVLTGRDRGPWARQRLTDEAAKARRVDHPNVVRVLDRGASAEDEDFIVHEYVGGGDLAAWLEGRTLTPRQAAALAAKIARGVHAAHAAGLVHCDLKPGNILMSPEGEPRVSDFGIAIREGEGFDAIRERDDGRPVGNIAFISPEQFRMEPGSLTAASDIYALGGMIFFLLTRRFPNGSSADEVARTHDAMNGRQQAPRIRSLARGLDGDIEAICRKAMDPKPELRYASAAELADDLERWARFQPVRCRRSGPLRLAALACRRRPYVAAALLTAAVAIGAASAAARYWSNVAALRAAAGARTRWALNTQSQISSAYATVKSAWFSDGLDLDAMPPIIAVDWATDGAIFGNLLDPDGPWRHRLPIVKTLVKDREREHLGSSIDAELWRMTWARCELNMGHYDKAEAVLEDAQHRWRDKALPETDPWYVMMNQMRAVATAHLLSGAPAGDSIPALAASMSLLEPLVSGKSPGAVAALRQLAWEAVLTADVPSVLNRPVTANKAAQLIEKWEHDQPSTNSNSPTARALRSQAMTEIRAWRASRH